MTLYFYINPRLQIHPIKKVLRTIYIVEIARVAFLVSKYRPWTYFTSNFIGSSLPVIVCRMAHVIRHIYVISVCLRIVVSNLLDYMHNITDVLQEAGAVLSFESSCVQPRFMMGSVFVHLFVFWFLLCLFSSTCACLVCPMLPVSLDCSFFITPSVFSNVYLH